MADSDIDQCIEVEFFGIPRQRVNVPSATITMKGKCTLAEALEELARQFPNLVPDCIENGKLSAICSANVNGETFIKDEAHKLESSDRLLLMSSDAGG